MAGLLERIAIRVLGNLESKSSSQTRPRTTHRTAYSQPVRVKPVAPIVGPEEPVVEPTVSILDTPKVETIASVLDTPKVEPSVSVLDVQPDIEISSEKEKNKNSSVIITLEKEMTTENITVKNVPENSTVEKDDYLLSQIDEFRAKAQQLQKLLLTKESKVQELQEIVDEREVKARELAYILDERQKKADGITLEVTKQIDSLIDKVSEKMEAIGASLGKELQEGQRLNERQLEELKDTLGALNGQQIEEIKSVLGSLNAQQAEELKNTLSELNSQLEVVKSDLSDKVHSENVQCYRNLADLLKSVEEKLDKANEIEKKVVSVHKCTVAIIVLSVINMLGLAALALYEMGIFQLLFG